MGATPWVGQEGKVKGHIGGGFGGLSREVGGGSGGIHAHHLHMQIMQILFPLSETSPVLFSPQTYAPKMAAVCVRGLIGSLPEYKKKNLFTSNAKNTVFFSIT